MECVLKKRCTRRCSILYDRKTTSRSQYEVSVGWHFLFFFRSPLDLIIWMFFVLADCVQVEVCSPFTSKLTTLFLFFSASHDQIGFIFLFYRCTNHALSWQPVKMDQDHHPVLSAPSSWSTNELASSFASLTLRSDNKGRFGCRFELVSSQGHIQPLKHLVVPLLISNWFAVFAKVRHIVVESTSNRLKKEVSPGWLESKPVIGYFIATAWTWPLWISMR